jgi:hypothetical protein
MDEATARKKVKIQAPTKPAIQKAWNSSRQEASFTGRHAALEGAPRHPAIDLSRDPTRGKPDHAKPDDDCG